MLLWSISAGRVCVLPLDPTPRSTHHPGRGMPGERRCRCAPRWPARPAEPLSLETVELDGPRDGEVLVEIKATGICHTDEYTLSGADPEGIFPAILGHEGAGVVVDIGRRRDQPEKGRSRHSAVHAGVPAVRILPQRARPICAWRSARRRARG